MPVSARIQPQGRVRINRANPFGKRAKFVYVAGQNRDFAGGLTATSSGTTLATGRNGLALRTGTAQGTFNYLDFGYVQLNSAFSFLVRVKRNAPSSGNYDAIAGTVNSNQYYFGFLVEPNGNRPYFEVRCNSATSGVGGSSGAALSTTDYETLLGVNDGTTLTIYRNGLFVASGSSPGFPFNSNGTFRLGKDNRPPQFNTGLSCDISECYILDGALSAAEALDISNRPYQLFEAPAPMLYAASAPTVVDGSATPSGVSASSTVGSAAASGQGRVAPAGVSAAASVGTVSAAGTTVVNGTASATGVGASAAVGTPAASGAANKLVSGVSASSSVGTVTAAGTVVVNGTATPAGVSAAASVGSVSASGATVVHGNASAAGVAAASAVGSVAANGAARATPNGVQVAAAIGTVSANGGVSVAGNAQPAGVSAAASVGTPSASGATVTHGNASAAGVAVAASVGSVTVSASARAMPAGVSVLATIGQPIAAGQIQVSGNALPSGVLARTYIGSVIAGSVTFTRAPPGPGYSRPFTNTTRPRQVNTRRP